MQLLTVTQIELYKIFSKLRTYIGFVTILIFIPLIMFLIRKFGIEFETGAIQQLQEHFYTTGSLINGFLISYYLMNILWIHFPFFIMLVAGDVVAGEGHGGTLRILLTRPVSRTTILTGKFLATMLYTGAIIFFLGLVSLGTGTLFLGTGDLLVFDSGILILSSSQAFLRFILAYLLAFFVQALVASLSFTFSSFVNNSIGPIIGSYAIIIASYIFTFIKIPGLEFIQPYFFTYYFDIFFLPFKEPLPWAEIAHQLLIILAYIISLFLISLIHFNRKDITT